MARQLTAEQLEELRSVDSPTVSNAIEAFKVRDDTQGFLGMEVKSLGYHVFAAGLVVAHGTFNIIDVGIPVEVSGLRIQPGDLLHGDSSGVTTIPLEIADKLYGECLKVRDREAALPDYAHSRDFSFEGLKAKLLGR